MRKSLLLAAVLGTFALPAAVMAEDAAPAADAAPAPAPAAEPAPPYTLTYNIGLYSQYIFRGLTQTGEEPAIQGGVDFAHSSGFYLGTWGSNISWLEDGGTYDNASLEWDIYGGYANNIGDTGIGYNVGVLQYIYPGDTKPGVKKAETTEIYGALSYKWLQAKVSVVASDGAFGVRNADGTYYAELNANYPIGDTGLTVNAHIGRQEYSGSTAGVSNDVFSYTDYKLGLTKSWTNGINVGGYFTDTNAKKAGYGAFAGGNIADSEFTAFIQKTF
ncbi:MAG TPA: TorF family putative porin [Methylophilaceae bacterium]